MLLKHLSNGDGSIDHQNALNDIYDCHGEAKQESVECADTEGPFKLHGIFFAEEHSQSIPYFRESNILLNGQEGHYNGKNADKDYNSCNNDPDKSHQQLGKDKAFLADGKRVHQVALVGIKVPVKTYRKVD